MNTLVCLLELEERQTIKSCRVLRCLVAGIFGPLFVLWKERKDNRELTSIIKKKLVAAILPTNNSFVASTFVASQFVK
jgi:hypothetical protein